MQVGRIKQFVAWSAEGPTFHADLRGLVFTDGICGPLSAAMAERAALFGARTMEVDPTDGLEWEHDDATGWTLKAVPARAELAPVELRRLLVLDPDDPPAELSPEVRAFVGLFDLRSGKRRGTK